MRMRWTGCPRSSFGLRAQSIVSIRIASPLSSYENARMVIHRRNKEGNSIIGNRSGSIFLQRRRLCTGALGVAFVLLANSAAVLALERAADPDPARFAADIRAFEAWDRQNSFPPRAVLFVGSSSIRMWQTAESFPDSPVINRGFGGSHISDVNHFADRIVLKYRPVVVVFYAGDNDIADGKTPEQVSQDFEQFVGHLHERLPAAQVIYLPIKPSLLRWERWPQMQKANELIHQFTGNNNRLSYVDTATPMLGNDGRPRAELFVEDGLHLNAEGYRLWNGLVRPAIERVRTAGE